MMFQALRHRARIVAGVVALGLVAFSPFVVYFATRGSASVVPSFPAPIALVAVKDGVLREVGVLHPTPVPGIARFPADTSLILPRAGTLRAATAFSIVGSEQMNDAMSATLGLVVPFWIEGDAASIESLFATGDVESNLGAHLTRARELFAQGRTQMFLGAGRYEKMGTTRSFVPDARAVRAALRDPSLRVDAKPTPSPAPSIAPKSVRVDVLNKSGIANGAARTAEALRKKGFKITRTGSATNVKPATTIVHYAKNKAMGDLVAKALGIKGLKATPLPKGLKVTGDVLVLVGRDAFPKS